ncbi:MAG: type IV pilus biogenesis/stability protein PilW [Burkholderiales bacterium]|nr:type IV pilus biogenesis/stability protein PilW [Burkholderiales bacterium]
MMERSRLGAAALAGAALLALGACSGVAGLGKGDEPPQNTSQSAEEDPLRYRARLHTELGANYFQRGQMSVALEELREATRLDPKYGMAHSILGLVYGDLGEPLRAEAAFRQAIAVAPAEGDIRNNYGSFLCRQNRAAEGLDQFDAALQLPLYQTPQVALENAGSCALGASLIRRAENYFARLVQMQPLYSRGYQGLAAIALKTSRFDEARRQVRLALNAQPATPELYYYGACAERQLGDRNAENSYAQQLKSRFADSPLNGKLEKGLCE